MNRQGYFFNHSMPASGKIGRKWTGKVSWYRHNMRLNLHDSFDEISITRNIGEECIEEIWCHGMPSEAKDLAVRSYFAFPVKDGGLKIWRRREHCFSEHATMAEAVEALGICAECECLRRRFGCLCDEAGEPLRGEDGKRIECIEGFYCQHQCAIHEAACRSR